MPLIAFDRTHARTSYYALLRYWVPVYQCILFHQLRLSSLDWLSVPSFYRSSSVTLNLRIEQIGTVLASWFAMSSSLHQLFGILCITMMFVLRMSVSASPICPGSSITIRNPATGHVQCQKCLVCPAGQGLSVDCGDVITPQTAIVCKPCKQGMTYSSKSEAGACKTCMNCGEYRETIKSCTLTSNAVCGKNCTLGAYSEGIRGMCRPCSACCNDGNDYIEPKCKVPWVPKNKQCSDYRLKKCSKKIVNTTTVEENHSTSSTSTSTSTHTGLPVSPPVTRGVVRDSASTNDVSVPNGAIIGIVIGVLLVVLILAALFTYIVKTRQPPLNNGVEETGQPSEHRVQVRSQK